MNDYEAIRVNELTKYYGDFLAVDSISFMVERGGFFGFLGPNGAGKTTTLRILTGLLPPDGGEAEIMGYNIQHQSSRAKENMGIVPETSNTYLDLTAWENLMLMGRMYGMDREAISSRATRLLKIFELYDHRDQKTMEFSKGMRQRIVLCSALLHDPSLLFLDEPTSGLDVKSTRLIREILVQLNSEGKTIFLMTHNIEEASRLCNRVAIINEGQIAAIDTPQNLRQTIQKTRSLAVTYDENVTKKELEWLHQLPAVNRVEFVGDTIRLYTHKAHPALSSLIKRSEEEGLQVKSVNTLDPSLEDVFVRLTEGKDNDQLNSLAKGE